MAYPKKESEPKKMAGTLGGVRMEDTVSLKWWEILSDDQAHEWLR